MQLSVKNEKGDASVEVGEAVFGARFNESLVHQVVTAYMAGARAGTRKHKTRSEVSGGGAKPFRQKGTGRARAGTSRGPIWRGGGKTFASVPTSYEQKVNRKMYRGALRCILSELVREQRLTVVESFSVTEPKTGALAASLKEMGLQDVLIVVEGHEENLALAVRNLHWADVCTSADVDPLSLLAFENIVCTVPALKLLEERVS